MAYQSFDVYLPAAVVSNLKSSCVLLYADILCDTVAQSIKYTYGIPMAYQSWMYTYLQHLFSI